MQPLANADRRSSSRTVLRWTGWSLLVVAITAASVQGCIRIPGPHDVPVGVYHFRFFSDSAGSAPEELEALANRSGSLSLSTRERAGCDAPEGECWDLDGEYTLMPDGYAVVSMAMHQAGIPDSIPARGRAAGAWSGKPGGPFWVILNDRGSGPRVEFRATPGRRRHTAEGKWCIGACAGGAAGNLLIVRSKR
jgi:hypothetical protein